MATETELQWALTYDGYARMAASPEALYEILRPAVAEHASTGRIPDWCGVDFLRAWAFYRQREHHHIGHGRVAPDFYDVLEAIRRHSSATKRDLPAAGLPDDWSAHLLATLQAPYWSALMDFVTHERETHAVFPPQELMFRAFELTSYDDVRVVILGQDPYPTPGHADGLAFSVSDPAAKTPDSLRNIFTELGTDVRAPVPASSSLEGWARQGVLLLNTALTLRAGDDADHAAHRRWRWQRQGWHTFTDAAIAAISGEGAACRLHPVGRRRQKEGQAHRHRASPCHRAGASVAALCLQGLLRQQAVQSSERIPPRVRSRHDRLGTDRLS